MANDRNAGRKRKFDQDDVDKMFALINAGKNSGIKENMTVIASEGLVGFVISATDNTAC